MPKSTRPAFGQVWEWGGMNFEMMLVHPTQPESGSWLVVHLHPADPTPFQVSGLHDDPRQIIEGWVLLSEEN